MAATELDQIVNLCKRRGFVYPSAEIYGGFRSSYDYGPLGSLMLRNVREAWVRTMVAALSVRHGLQINLAHSAPGRCARPGGAASSIFAHLDANDAGPLLSGQDGLLRDTVKEVCQMEPQPVAVRDLVVQCRTALSLTPAVKTGRAHFQPQQPHHPAHMQFR
jgi:hypothetical protein